MKKIIALSLVISLFGCFTFAAFAEDKARRWPAKRGTGRDYVRRSHSGDFFKTLNLTKEQQAEISKIKEDTAKKIKALVEAQNEAIKKVLTAEQTKKLDEMKKKTEARREEMKKKFEEMKKKFEERRKGDKKVSDKKVSDKKVSDKKVYTPCQKSKLNVDAGYGKEGDVLEIS
jgi:Spy/CpxP family protein refolding chaperone